MELIKVSARCRVGGNPMYSSAICPRASLSYEILANLVQSRPIYLL